MCQFRISYHQICTEHCYLTALHLVNAVVKDSTFSPLFYAMLLIKVQNYTFQPILVLNSETTYRRFAIAFICAFTEVY